MRYRKVNTTPDTDNMTMQELIAHMNRTFVVRIKDSKEWVTGSISNSVNRSKAKVFESYSDAVDKVIRLKRNEFKDAEIFETY